jgi:hypothetical protein
MRRRHLVALALAGLPASALAQPAPARRARYHDEVLTRSYETLPPGAKERVAAAFRAGSPDVTEDAIRQRWDSMEPNQRGEVLTMHERRAGRGRGPGMGPGPGRGMGPGPTPAPARPPG